jgi:hypothetical protein
MIVREFCHAFTEEKFYEPFADWLRVDADEVVESMTLGGASFKSKWGTPDVVGAYKPRKSDFVQFDLEIVTAEIKIDPSQSVVALGQVCAHRLFSYKIVMPRSVAPDDQDRLETLCSIYGVGLVLFDLNPDTPDFQIAVKAQRFQPDMFDTNELPADFTISQRMTSPTPRRSRPVAPSIITAVPVRPRPVGAPGFHPGAVGAARRSPATVWTRIDDPSVSPTTSEPVHRNRE